jgi:hypothetical protein
MVPLRAELTKQVTTVVHETLRTTVDVLVQEPERLLLYAATDPVVIKVEVLVDPESVRVLLRLDGPDDDPAFLTEAG